MCAVQIRTLTCTASRYARSGSLGPWAEALILAAHEQRSLSSSDISFDLELSAAAKPNADVQWLHCHSSRMEGKGPRWVGASGVEGLPALEVDLAPGATEERPYTVRLYFAELRELAAGQRLFSLQLQGKEVLKNFDIAGEAGGTHRTLIKEFKGVQISNTLKVAMTPKADAPTPLPMLCGIEVIAESGP